MVLVDDVRGSLGVGVIEQLLAAQLEQRGLADVLQVLALRDSSDVARTVEPEPQGGLHGALPSLLADPRPTPRGRGRGRGRPVRREWGAEHGLDQRELMKLDGGRAARTSWGPDQGLCTRGTRRRA